MVSWLGYLVSNLLWILGSRQTVQSTVYLPHLGWLIEWVPGEGKLFEPGCHPVTPVLCPGSHPPQLEVSWQWKFTVMLITVSSFQGLLHYHCIVFSGRTPLWIPRGSPPSSSPFSSLCMAASGESFFSIGSLPCPVTLFMTNQKYLSMVFPGMQYINHYRHWTLEIVNA